MPQPERAARALDPDLLASQTLGDRALEAELFELFELQAVRLWPAIAAEGPALERSAAAHALKGGAAAVGATEVMRLAGEIEIASDRQAPGVSELVAGLGVALSEARQAIAEWRRAGNEVRA